MRRLPPLLVVSALVAFGVLLAVLAFFLFPGAVVDDAHFKNHTIDAAVEEKRLKALHDVRTVGVQLIGALAVIVGGALTWRTVWQTRESQITDRFAGAVQQLGDPKLRVGAIYALGRVARDSHVDHATVMTLLGEFLRAEYPSIAPDGTRTPDDGRRESPADVRAVAAVLRQRHRRWDPKAPRLNFSGIHFGRVPLQGVDLRNVDLRDSNLAGAFLSDAKLGGAWMERVVLRAASLQRSDLRDAKLNGANLRYTHATNAIFCGAVLDEAQWGRTDLEGANLRRATGVPEDLPSSTQVIFNDRTVWPWDRGPRARVRAIRRALATAPGGRFARERWHRLRRKRTHDAAD